jgi:signal transduction histidine kinase
MRLHDFISENTESILQAWEDFAASINTPGASLNREDLRDHAGQMLEAIVVDLRKKQTLQERIDKSQGHGPENECQTPAETHAVSRLMAGFTIDQMVSEYRALRTSVLIQWMKMVKSGPLPIEIDDMTRFHEAIDQALAESIASYSRAVEASHNLFLGILGHDLRTPLGAILLGSDSLRRSTVADIRVTKIASQIYTSVGRARQIVDDLLDLTRCQMGPGIPIRTETLDLTPLCQRIVEEIRTFHPKSVLQLEADGPVIGEFDGPRMEQVFSNIVSNAIQHGANETPIKIKLALSENQAHFSVHNFGEPIAADVLPFIFNPMGRFSQRSVVDHPPAEGLGLGLFIASEIVASHEGSIEVQSDMANGTTFQVKIPISLAKAA